MDLIRIYLLRQESTILEPNMYSSVPITSAFFFFSVVSRLDLLETSRSSPHTNSLVF